jgi:tRNA-specific 2-thiouridylase
VNWHPVAGGTDPGSFEAVVKIRYSHPGTISTVTPLENNRARIRLHEPQRAVTPGQAAVIYDGDAVLGGGWICRSASTRHPEPRKLSGSKDPAIIPLAS